MQRFRARGLQIIDTHPQRDVEEEVVASAVKSRTLAKRIANALNIYKPRKKSNALTKFEKYFEK